MRREDEIEKTVRMIFWTLSGCLFLYIRFQSNDCLLMLENLWLSCITNPSIKLLSILPGLLSGIRTISTTNKRSRPIVVNLHACAISTSNGISLIPRHFQLRDHLFWPRTVRGSWRPSLAVFLALQITWWWRGVNAQCCLPCGLYQTNALVCWCITRDAIVQHRELHHAVT